MTTNTNEENGHAPAPGIKLLTQLRKTMPVRPLAYYEHLILAERQAGQLHGLLEQREPGVSLDWLTDGKLGNIDVVMTPRWRMESLAGRPLGDRNQQGPAASTAALHAVPRVQACT
jgi:hypothetical protein